MTVLGTLVNNPKLCAGVKHCNVNVKGSLAGKPRNFTCFRLNSFRLPWPGSLYLLTDSAPAYVDIATLPRAQNPLTMTGMNSVFLVFAKGKKDGGLTVDPYLSCHLYDFFLG